VLPLLLLQLRCPRQSFPQGGSQHHKQRHKTHGAHTCKDGLDVACAAGSMQRLQHGSTGGKAAGAL